MMMGNGFGLGMSFMGVFGLVIVALLATAVALLWRSAGDREEVDPRRILAGRLARGEITEDEYRRRLDLLRPGDPGPVG